RGSLRGGTASEVLLAQRRWPGAAQAVRQDLACLRGHHGRPRGRSGGGGVTESRHTATGADEVAAYVAAVRDALADLPPRERDELLEDLTAHLTEVAA